MTVSILGCGWLGFPTGTYLMQQGFSVKGSTTSRDKLNKLQDAGITPFLINITDKIECEDCESFWNSDLLLLNIPPGRSKPGTFSRHTAQVKAIINKLLQHKIKWVIFASSTSVYPLYGGLKREDDTDPSQASSESGRALLKCEELLLDNDEFDTTVIRFGGLYGYDRNPVKYLAGKQNLKNGNKPINLIHRDDCIRIIHEIIKQNSKNTIYNAVTDGHPSRKKYYTSAAAHYGLKAPGFLRDSKSDYRIVSNEKLKKELDYQFLYPNPLDHTP